MSDDELRDLTKQFLADFIKNKQESDRFDIKLAHYSLALNDAINGMLLFGMCDEHLKILIDKSIENFHERIKVLNSEKKEYE